MASEKVDTDVVIVGAGISGINFAYRLQERCPNLSYTILEGRHELGGTWSLFKYPGLRSDSDLYTFGFPWRPWTEKNSIARSDLIVNYVRESAQMYGIDKHIEYDHMVNDANWSTSSKTWTMNVTVNGSEQKTIRSRWMIYCTGYYDYDTPLSTVIPGIDSFKGQVVHPQFWPKDLDYANKEYFSAYIAKDNEITDASCGKGAVTARPWGGEDRYPPPHNAKSPKGYVIEFEGVGERGFWVNVTTADVTIPDKSVYDRYVGTAEGGFAGAGEKRWKGVAEYEQFKV